MRRGPFTTHRCQSRAAHVRHFLDIPRIINEAGTRSGAAPPPVEGGGEESGEPRGARWGAPWGGEWGTPWGTVGSAMGRRVERAMEPARGGWGFCTIRSIATACRRRVASLLMQFPPRNGEESGEPRGARWGARGKRGREARSPLTDTEAGARPRAPPPLNPAVGQVSRRSSGRPSVVPDPE